MTPEEGNSEIKSLSRYPRLHRSTSQPREGGDRKSAFLPSFVTAIRPSNEIDRESVEKGGSRTCLVRDPFAYLAWVPLPEMIGFWHQINIHNWRELANSNSSVEAGEIIFLLLPRMLIN
jgi:hypothetical protein